MLAAKSKENIEGEVASPPTPPTVFYDGSCPLCQREIGFYRGQAGAADVAWVDVSTCPAGAVASDLTQQAAMQRFHVRRSDGTLVSGAAAFAELWLTLPRWRWAGRIAKLPVVSTVLEGAYRAFLPVRPYLQRWFRQREL
jgi:predicted DCC family thiol-disulfide oxidoreductase YuxK